MLLLSLTFHLQSFVFLFIFPQVPSISFLPVHLTIFAFEVILLSFFLLILLAFFFILQLFVFTFIIPLLFFFFPLQAFSFILVDVLMLTILPFVAFLIPFSSPILSIFRFVSSALPSSVGVLFQHFHLLF